jgi:hypothetical protein
VEDVKFDVEPLARIITYLQLSLLYCTVHCIMMLFGNFCKVHAAVAAVVVCCIHLLYAAVDIPVWSIMVGRPEDPPP